MLKKTLLFVALLACAQTVCAEKILSVDFEVYKDDSVRLNYARLEEGNPTQFISPGDYELRLTGRDDVVLYQTPMKISFLVLSDPPTDIDPFPVNLRIKYVEGMSRLSIHKRNSTIYSQELVLCNGDGACDPVFESYLSCPGDCPLSGPDGVCIKDADGTCDPDCMKGSDPDCGKESEGIFEQCAYLLVIVVLLAPAAFFILGRMKKR